MQVVEIHIGKTSRKSQLGKYNSENKIRTIQVEKLQLGKDKSERPSLCPPLHRETVQNATLY